MSTSATRARFALILAVLASTFTLGSGAHVGPSKARAQAGPPLGSPVVQPNVTEARRPMGPFLALGAQALIADGPARIGGRLELGVPFLRSEGHGLAFHLPAMILHRALEIPEFGPEISATLDAREYSFWLLPGVQYEYVARPGGIVDRVSLIADIGVGPVLFVRNYPDVVGLENEPPRDWDFAGRASVGGRYVFPSGFLVTLTPLGGVLTFRNGVLASYEASLTAGYRFP